MPKYYVNKKTDDQGDHEVHKEGCPWTPLPENRIDLGYHTNCQSAITKAKTYYSRVNGHSYCSADCHTS
ncbi:MAG TPA: hypothetical protein DCE41_08905 [Cytophagales bacterium]|nr:hypothetical protein [Cytophagales bacterium]HAP61985.1 hypothetical protein [Cytophagales bacterium]